MPYSATAQLNSLPATARYASSESSTPGLSAAPMQSTPGFDFEARARSTSPETSDPPLPLLPPNGSPPAELPAPECAKSPPAAPSFPPAAPSFPPAAPSFPPAALSFPPVEPLESCPASPESRRRSGTVEQPSMSRHENTTPAALRLL